MFQGVHINLNFLHHSDIEAVLPCNSKASSKYFVGVSKVTLARLGAVCLIVKRKSGSPVLSLFTHIFCPSVAFSHSLCTLAST